MFEWLMLSLILYLLVFYLQHRYMCLHCFAIYEVVISRISVGSRLLCFITASKQVRQWSYWNMKWIWNVTFKQDHKQFDMYILCMVGFMESTDRLVFSSFQSRKKRKRVSNLFVKYNLDISSTYIVVFFSHQEVWWLCA